MLDASCHGFHSPRRCKYNFLLTDQQGSLMLLPVCGPTQAEVFADISQFKMLPWMLANYVLCLFRLQQNMWRLTMLMKQSLWVRRECEVLSYTLKKKWDSLCAVSVSSVFTDITGVSLLHLTLHRYCLWGRPWAHRHRDWAWNAVWSQSNASGCHIATAAPHECYLVGNVYWEVSVGKGYGGGG